MMDSLEIRVINAVRDALDSNEYSGDRLDNIRSIIEDYPRERDGIPHPEEVEADIWVLDRDWNVWENALGEWKVEVTELQRRTLDNVTHSVGESYVGKVILPPGVDIDADVWFSDCEVPIWLRSQVPTEAGGLK